MSNVGLSPEDNLRQVVQEFATHRQSREGPLLIPSIFQRRVETAFELSQKKRSWKQLNPHASTHEIDEWIHDLHSLVTTDISRPMTDEEATNFSYFALNGMQVITVRKKRNPNQPPETFDSVEKKLRTLLGRALDSLKINTSESQEMLMAGTQSLLKRAFTIPGRGVQERFFSDINLFFNNLKDLPPDSTNLKTLIKELRDLPIEPSELAAFEERVDRLIKGEATLGVGNVEDLMGMIAKERLDIKLGLLWLKTRHLATELQMRIENNLPLKTLITKTEKGPIDGDLLATYEEYQKINLPRCISTLKDVEEIEKAYALLVEPGTLTQKLSFDLEVRESNDLLYSLERDTKFNRYQRWMDLIGPFASEKLKTLFEQLSAVYLSLPSTIKDQTDLQRFKEISKELIPPSSLLNQLDAEISTCMTTLPLDMGALCKLFPKVKDIDEVARKKIIKAAEKLVSGEYVSETTSIKLGKQCYQIKCRYVENEIEIKATKTKPIGSGAFKKAFKTAHIFGPSISKMGPGVLSIYAKPTKKFEKGEKRKQWNREIRQECECSHILAKESPFILESHTVSKIWSPQSVKGVLMEFCDGGDVEDRVDKHPFGKEFLPLSALQENLDIAKNIASGLETMHRLNYCHRDLKESNVFLKKQGKTLIPKLADFGFTDKKGKVVKGAGTFSPPEMLDDRGDIHQPLTEAVDMWDYGLILLHLVHGFPSPLFNAKHTKPAIPATKIMTHQLSTHLSLGKILP